jgi:hypothetical protein
MDPAKFTNAVTIPYLPLSPGTTFVSTGQSAGAPERNVVTVTRRTKTIVGVPCVVVPDVVSERIKVIEATWDWFAQDSDGNVWYFGEDSKENKNGKVTSAERPHRPLHRPSPALRLRKVLVCAPGLAHRRLTHSNNDELHYVLVAVAVAPVLVTPAPQPAPPAPTSARTPAQPSG